MTPEVEVAITEVRTAHAGRDIEVTPEAQGGAYVVLHGVNIGDQYQPSTSWVGFLVTFQYPNADVYPHFLDGAVRRRDGQPLGEGMSGPMEWNGRNAIQVSRRSNRWNPARDTACVKLAKVLEWVRSR